MPGGSWRSGESAGQGQSVRERRKLDVDLGGKTDGQMRAQERSRTYHVDVSRELDDPVRHASAIWVGRGYTWVIRAGRAGAVRGRSESRPVRVRAQTRTKLFAGEVRSEQARGESGLDGAMARPELSPMADAGVFKRSGLCRGLNSDLISERVLARPGEAAGVIVRSDRGQTEFW